MYGLHFCCLNVLHELADEVAIGGNGCDGRFLNLLLCLVGALTFEHSDIVLLEVTVDKIYNLLFGHALNTLETSYLLLPWCAVDECFNEHVGTCAVALE